MKTCPTCKLTLSAENYHRNKNTKDGLSIQCKHCRAEYFLKRKRPKIGDDYQGGMTPVLELALSKPWVRRI